MKKREVRWVAAQRQQQPNKIENCAKLTELSTEFCNLDCSALPEPPVQMLEGSVA